MLLVFVYFHSLLIKFQLSFSLSPRSPGVAYPQPEPIQRPFWKVWPQSKTLSDLLFNHNIPFIPVPHTQDFLALFTLLYKIKTFCWDSCLSHSQSALRRESALLSDPFPYCTPPSALPGILSHKASSQWVWIFFFLLDRVFMKKSLIYICIWLMFKVSFLCEKMKDSFCMYGMWQGDCKVAGQNHQCRGKAERGLQFCWNMHLAEQVKDRGYKANVSLSFIEPVLAEI